MESKFESQARPLVPPKPDKIGSPSPLTLSSSDVHAQDKNRKVSVPSQSSSSEQCKPALPPKPNRTSSTPQSVSVPPTPIRKVTSTQDHSPPLIVPKGKTSLAIANAILANANSNTRSQKPPPLPTTPRPSPRPTALVLTPKSQSLGRNVAPPTSSSISVGQFLSNKASSLARMLPLDLNFGSKISPYSYPPSQFHIRPSPVPPPPPPRLRRKLSPTSPTKETCPPIYAEIDKEKKWAKRREKEESIDGIVQVERVDEEQDVNDHSVTGSLVITINRETNDPKVVEVKSEVEVQCEITQGDYPVPDRIEEQQSEPSAPQDQEPVSVLLSNGKKGSLVTEVESWLGNYLKEQATLNPSESEGQDFPVPVPASESEPDVKYHGESESQIEVQTQVSIDSLPLLVENNSFLYSHLDQEQEEMMNNRGQSPESLLLAVDSKIQSVVSKLSNLSGKSSPQVPNDGESESPIIIPLTVEALTITEIPTDSTSTSCDQVKEDTTILSSSSLEVIHERNSILRRRSWTCPDDTNSSSSSSSLNNSHQINIHRGSDTRRSGPPTCWVDSGDSTGVLGDVDTSTPNQSSEDIPRRKKMSWLFSSFGKGSKNTKSSNCNRPSDSISRIVSSPIISTTLSPTPPVPAPAPTPDPGPDPSHRYSESSLSSSISDPDVLPPPISEPDPDFLSSLPPKEQEAFKVAREILTSELTFISVLDLLTISFPNAIQTYESELKHPIITPQDMDNILCGLPNLKRVNQELAQDMKSRISNWSFEPKISDIFVTKGPFLKLYSHYIRNFYSLNEKLDRCCSSSPHFSKALKDFEMSEICHKLGLRHYMLKPVQRMPQYYLLLEKYLKYLEPDSMDYENTTKALNIVKDVAEHADEAIKLQMNAEKLLQLQTRLGPGVVIMKANRQLIKDGELQKVCRKEMQTRFLALMNDCLICMTYVVGTSSSDLRLRHELPLAGMRVAPSEKEDCQNEFSVITTIRSFNLVAKSSKEREEWIKALTDAINDNIRKRTLTDDAQDMVVEPMTFKLGKIAPVWIQDSRVTMCQICTAEFTRIFRRHHCRSCGKVVCHHCSDNKAPLQYLKNDAAKVCDECYQYLLEEFDQESQSQSLHANSNEERDLIRSKFKKVTLNISKRAQKLKRQVPSRLEINANHKGSRISGYLYWKEKKNHWKKRWFVLMERVLYVYAASEDIVAIKAVPVLGWSVDFERSECMESSDPEAVFKLSHNGQNPILFQAESQASAERWIGAMKEATILA